MTEINDKLLKQFFSENKPEIADNGFSRRVMRNLPEDKGNKVYTIWSACCVMVALIVFFTQNSLQLIVDMLRGTFISMMEYGVANLDIKSLLIAGAVLLFLGVRRIITAE